MSKKITVGATAGRGWKQYGSRRTGRHFYMSFTNKLKIFLSHSGLDADRSLALQREIGVRFKKLGYGVKVFNTSTVEDRFKELELTSGGDWREQNAQYETELRHYIQQNLVASTAYLLLVTPASLEAKSRWIRFEIDAARSKAASRKRPFFFPCVADGAALAELPEGAYEFQGIELETPEWLEKLTQAILH
jgi:hypothetical protein